MKHKNNWYQKAKLKKLSDEIKAQRGCKFCGERDPVCLAFHHRNRGEKEDNISKIVSSGGSLERFNHEVDKCDVMCHNCHAKLEAQLKAAGAFPKQKPPSILPGMWENQRRRRERAIKQAYREDTVGLF